MNKKVGIVLVNYKQYANKYLKACRDSLREQTYPHNLFQVYIIDNASNPESLNYLQNNYPEAIILPRKDGNYSAANNLGFRQALRDSSDYLVTLNMDTEVDKDWLKELVFALENNHQAGLAQSKILLYSSDKSKSKINSLGNIIHFLGFGFTSSYQKDDYLIKGYPEIKGYASGCSFIIRKDVFLKIGGYLEEYYMYHDDLELSLRARLLNYKIILAPRSIVYHKYEFSRSVKMIYYMERNRYLNLFIFYPFYLLILLLLPLLVMDLGLIVFSLFRGEFSLELKIKLYFLNYKNWFRIIKERKKIKKIALVSFQELAQDFSGRIDFQEINNPLLKYIVNPCLNLYWKIIKKII